MNKIPRLKTKWQALTQLTLMCLKYKKGRFSPNVTWLSYFLILWHSLYGKREKSLEKFFLQLWKSNLFDFIEISGNVCANTNIQ